MHEACVLVSVARQSEPKKWGLKLEPSFAPRRALPRLRSSAAPRALCFGVGALALAGCTSLGARTIPGARFDYNDAIVRSFDNQMLLNLVRLRYQDSIFFLDLSSVVASYRREVSGSVSPSGVVNPASYNWAAAAGGAWSESPTISYVPLQGEDFAKRLLAPVEPSAILLLSRSGWGLERLLLCTVQQLNELPNGTAIGGVAPVQVLHFERFQRVATLLRTLQEDGYIQLNTLADPPDTVAMTAGPIPMTDNARAMADEVIDLLDIRSREGAPIALDAPAFPRKPAQVVLVGRSLLGVMTFLAQQVLVPDEHVRAGLVRITKGPDGKPFDWNHISRGLFRVHSGRSEPENAYLKVEYRGHWFWIDDTDLETKSTYTLLAQLFSLQSANGRIQAPVLTIPAR
jgi:hypothetical protein